VQDFEIWSSLFKTLLEILAHPESHTPQARAVELNFPLFLRRLKILR
jgi:hypothetical protein